MYSGQFYRGNGYYLNYNNSPYIGGPYRVN